jgi:hypothetical protein
MQIFRFIFKFELVLLPLCSSKSGDFAQRGKDSRGSGGLAVVFLFINFQNNLNLFFLRDMIQQLMLQHYVQSLI